MPACAPAYKPVRLLRRALTLIEVLVALTMTLIVLGAMMAAFQYASQKMAQGRAVMEMANRARSVEDFLRSDLASVTVEPRPYTNSTEPNGYFEYIEGEVSDDTNTGTPATAYLGDYDDVLAMTIRAQDGVLFRGRTPSGLQQSSLGEVVWFTTLNEPNSTANIVEFEDSLRIHRRLLLIRPDFGQVLDEATGNDVIDFLQNFDLSVRVVPGDVTAAGSETYDVFANNLQDLARRENRFCHFFSGLNFPNAFQLAPVPQYPPAGGLPRDARQSSSGDDLMLTDVAAFDLRAFSPNARVYRDVNANLVIQPGDPGYQANANLASTGALPANMVEEQLGAYVDLNYIIGATPAYRNDEWFINQATVNNYGFPPTGPVQTFNGSTAVLGGVVYDTWTPSYESDGFNQDGDALVDEGTNGLDDGGTAAPDDNAERETFPPYSYPIRGMQVTIRLIEKGTKQVHQTSIIHSYVPE